MEMLPSVRWRVASFAGILLGLMTSVIPFLLWRKLALNQGNELAVDALIVFSLSIGSWLFLRHSNNVVYASIELAIMLFISSNITAVTVLIMDRYQYEPMNITIILNGLVASLIFAIPAFILVFFYLRLFKRV